MAPQQPDRCHDCANFNRGYRVYGSKVPSSCNRWFHTVHGDGPACPEYCQHLKEADDAE